MSFSQKDDFVGNSPSPRTPIESTPLIPFTSSQQEMIVLRDSTSISISSQKDMDIEIDNSPRVKDHDAHETMKMRTHIHIESHTLDPIPEADPKLSEDSVAHILSSLSIEGEQDIQRLSPSQGELKEMDHTPGP